MSLHRGGIDDMTWRNGTWAVLALLVLTGCGGGEPSPQPTPEATLPSSDEDIPVREIDAPIEAATYERFALAAGDLDLYAKGLAFENARLLDATQQTGDARMEAFVAALPEQTEPAAAESLGITVDRYRNVKQAVNDVLGKFDAQAMLQSIQSGTPSDTSAPPLGEAAAAMQAEIDDPYAGLDPVVAEAFAARKDELAQLRADNVALLFKAGA
jgi:hypothetical protein